MTGMVYVGSTCEQHLSQRSTNHVSDYKKYIASHSRPYISSYEVLKNNNYEILLLEMCPCDNRDVLLMRERHYIENMECVNRYKPLKTTADVRASNKKFYDANKEKLLLGIKEYRQKNKEKMLERDKAQRVKFKEQRKEHLKQWKEKNKDKVKEHRQKDNKKRRLKTLYLQQLKFYNF